MQCTFSDGIAHQFQNFGDQRHVDLLESGIDGDALDLSVLDVGQPLHFLNGQVGIALSPAGRLHPGGDENGVAYGEIAFELRPGVAKDEKFSATLEVFDADFSEGAASFGDAFFGRGDDSAESDLLIDERVEVGHCRHADGAEIVEHNGIVVEGVSADVDADELALAVEFLEIAPAFEGGRGLWFADLHSFAVAKERIGAFFVFHLETLAIGEQRIEVGQATLALSEELFAAQFAEAVESTGERETFEVLAVADVEIHALEEVEHRGEFPSVFALIDDGLHGVVSESLDAAESEADVAEVVDREFSVALVDVGAEAD